MGTILTSLYLLIRECNESLTITNGSVPSTTPFLTSYYSVHRIKIKIFANKTVP